MELRPISFNSTGSLDDLPDIVLGAGVFNYQYHSDPFKLSPQAIINRAFKLGIRAIDTSSYYGPSEEIVGKALLKLRDDWPRESYFLCTKAGRLAVDAFDYDPVGIRQSVERSLARLNTEYLDVLYIHDVEFVDTDLCLEAIEEAFKLKDENKVRWVGISGYPLDYLYFLSKKCLEKLGKPLDVVLSYSNFCLQNTRLENFADKFKTEASVSKVINASPLSMSLLRAQPAHEFHPASAELKQAVARVASFTASQGIDLAGYAARFVFRNWNGPIVFGLSNVSEVERAVSDYWMSMENGDCKIKDEDLLSKIRDIFGDMLDTTWPSGIEHEDMT